MGVLQTRYLAYWWVSNWFFHELSYVKKSGPTFLSLFSMSFVLQSTICLVSWIPRKPVLCSPGEMFGAVWRGCDIIWVDIAEYHDFTLGYWGLDWFGLVWHWMACFTCGDDILVCKRNIMISSSPLNNYLSRSSEPLNTIMRY